jgi:FkbH-like protein
MRYADILRKNAELERTLDTPPCGIAVLSNLVVHSLKEILEFALRSARVNATVTVGEYDRLPAESERLAGSRAVFLFWEAANLADGLSTRAALLSPHELEALEAKTRDEIDRVFANLARTALVIVNRFTPLPFNLGRLQTDAFEGLCRRLNEHMDGRAGPNMLFVDTANVIAELGVDRSFDLRYFYSSKSLYSVDFLEAYARLVAPAVLSAEGRARKVLVLDCDNTLWNGILDECGPDGIEMSRRTAGGAPFAEVQEMALDLARRGVLLALCSRNAPADVDAILARHPDMRLRDGDIAVRKVNWDDKTANLQAIAAELNVGLDSLVFVDDSDFETTRVRERLPEVHVFQVPRAPHRYPALLRQTLNLFFSLSQTPEDRERGRMYRAQRDRSAARDSASSLEDYLTSLGLKMTVFENDASLVPRMAQLTQKTNQFNLTTRRYTEADIARMVADPAFRVFAFSLADRFGDNGVTGLSIVAIDAGGTVAAFDTFLLSCRIIGRNAEFAFLDAMVKRLAADGVTLLRGCYAPTARNGGVRGFYADAGFRLTGRAATHDEYEIAAKDYAPRNPAYIEVRHG